MGFKSKRSKETEFSPAVRKRIWERDNGCCIFCGRPGAPNAHYKPRSMGGLGREDNGVTACVHCHHMMDNSHERKLYLEKAKTYLQSHYPNWNEEDLIYNKWAGLKIGA